jgi:hypothetical protein
MQRPGGPSSKDATSANPVKCRVTCLLRPEAMACPPPWLPTTPDHSEDQKPADQSSWLLVLFLCRYRPSPPSRAASSVGRLRRRRRRAPAGGATSAPYPRYARLRGEVLVTSLRPLVHLIPSLMCRVVAGGGCEDVSDHAGGRGVPLLVQRRPVQAASVPADGELESLRAKVKVHGAWQVWGLLQSRTRHALLRGNHGHDLA